MIGISDLIQIIPAVGAGSVLTWAGNAALQWLSARDERRNANAAATLDLEKHSDQLMFDVLEQSRTELAGARAELEVLRPIRAKFAVIEGRLANFEEAINHLQALLETKDPAEHAQAERLARAFVNRMRRLGEAQGTLANEAQRAASAAALGLDTPQAG